MTRSKIVALTNGLIFAAALKLSAQEPQITSLFPLGGKQGTTFEIQIQGQNLNDTHGVWLDCEALQGEIRSVKEIRLDATGKSGDEERPKAHQVTLLVNANPSARTGAHAFRLVSSSGVSNAMWLQVNAETTLSEHGISSKAGEDVELPAVPVVVNGRISKKGEADSFSFRAEKGQLMKFEVLTGVRGWPTSPSNPLLKLYEPTGTWLDPNRPVRLAINDESIFCLPQLTYRFQKSGRFIIQVSSVNGQGGPNYCYQLRIVPADPKAAEGQKWLSQTLVHSDVSEWQERSFARPITPDRLKLLSSRTALHQKRDKNDDVTPKPSSLPTSQEETVNRAEVKSGSVMMAMPTLLTTPEKEPNNTSNLAVQFAVPSIVEGAIERPGDVDYFRFKVNAAETLAFEIQTPDTPPLRFNPRLEVTDSRGSEVLTNVYRKVEGDGDDWVKTIEPKTVCKFDDAGEYFLQIRDLTARHGDSHFRYRVLVRQQIAHMGEITALPDRVNIILGQTKKLQLSTVHEEGFSGEIVLALDGLPKGVQAFTATEPQPGEGLRGSNLVGGKINEERFRSVVQKATIVLSAAADVPVTATPVWAQLSAWPVVDGKAGPRHFVRSIPVMVIKPSKGQELTSGQAGQK